MSKDDPLFSGRGAPALISSKEPALHLLRERYSESFAITKGSGDRVHLFLIKIRMWSLVWTFTSREMGSNADINSVLKYLESAPARNPQFMEKLDASVSKAKKRIEAKANEFSR